LTDSSEIKLKTQSEVNTQLSTSYFDGIWIFNKFLL
jgi:hypothetical protein